MTYLLSDGALNRRTRPGMSNSMVQLSGGAVMGKHRGVFIDV